MTENFCGYPGCSSRGTIHCLEPKEYYYCSIQHREAYKYILTEYLLVNKPLSSFVRPDFSAIDSDIKSSEKVTTSSSNTQNSNSSESRQCRCMFCGESLLLNSEDEAVNHMEVCPALQEQLDSKKQFHIPSMVQKKLDEMTNKKK